MYNSLNASFQAIADCDRAVELNPQFHNALFRKAMALKKLVSLRTSASFFTRCQMHLVSGDMRHIEEAVRLISGAMRLITQLIRLVEEAMRFMSGAMRIVARARGIASRALFSSSLSTCDLFRNEERLSSL